MYIYEIKNTVNEKRCIGQTIRKDPRKRFNEHKWMLRHNVHRNPYLQNAWNKYGEENFEFNTLIPCNSLEELNQLEDEYVEKMGDYNLKPGGNHTPLTDEARIKISKANKKRPYPKIVDPDGKSWKITPTLEEFCRQHKLTSSAMRAVIYGRLNFHKGWHLTTTVLSWDEIRSKAHRKSDYSMVISPDGIEHEITNLRKFIRDNNLNRRHFTNMIQGKSQQHKGWHLKGTDIIDPNKLRSNANKGDKHPSARLTESEVLEIRRVNDEEKPSIRQLSNQYNLPKTTVWNIIHRKTWKHI